MFTCMHLYTCIYTCIYIHTCIYIFIYIYVCVYRRSLGHKTAHCGNQLKSPMLICHMMAPSLSPILTGTRATCGGVTAAVGAPPSAPHAACRESVNGLA